MVTYNPKNTVSTRINGQGDDLVNIKTRFTNVVETVMPRYLNLANYFVWEPMANVPTIWSDSISQAEVFAFDRDIPMTENDYDFGRVQLTLKKIVGSRGRRSIQDSIIDKYDVIPKIAAQQAEAIAEVREDAIAIQLCRAGLLQQSTFGTKGFKAAIQQQVGSSTGDWQDPTRLIASIQKAKQRFLTQNNVDVWKHGLRLAVRPDVFSVLLEAEQIVTLTDVRSDKGAVNPRYELSNLGLQIIQTSSIPQTEVKDFVLQDKNNTYDGDYTKVLGTFFTDKSLLCGELMGATPDVWNDPAMKAVVADILWSGGATPYRADHSGVILDI